MELNFETKKKIDEIKKKIIKKNQLTKTEYKQILAKINKVVKKITNSIKKNKLLADVIIGGSVAKETILKNNYDCDIFIRFNKKYKNENLSNLTEKILSIFKNITRVHGSRDYFNAKIDDIEFEFIPVLKIDSKKDAQNVTDFSPLHVKWIKSKIKKDSNLIKEIIITKQFCKTIRVYGAESYIAGFSGHLIEILLVKYKNFENLLINSLKWKKHEIIDVENFKTAKKINKSKINSIIVIDPVQPNRNAASALSFEKVEHFKKNALTFLKKPKIKYFIKSKITIDSIKKIKYDGKKIILKLYLFKNKKDITGSIILKIYNKLINTLLINDFEIDKSDFEWNLKNSAIIYIFVKKAIINKEKIWPGPPVKSKKHCLLFKEKHKNTFIKNNKIYAIVKKKYFNVDNLINDFINNETITKKIKNIEYIKI
ncbi:MAG: nucleotidyltransferase domain-containing protein [Candidatus Woesearchaeota archaeon]